MTSAKYLVTNEVSYNSSRSSNVVSET